MTDKSPQSDSALAPATTVRWHIVALLMATAFICHFNRISMSVAGTARIMDEYDIDKVQMGMVYSSYLLVYALCMIPGGWVIDRFGAKFALVAMGVGSAVCVCLTGCIGFLAVPALVLPSLFVIRSLTGMVSALMHPALLAWWPRGFHGKVARWQMDLSPRQLSWGLPALTTCLAC